MLWILFRNSKQATFIHILLLENTIQVNILEEREIMCHSILSGLILSVQVWTRSFLIYLDSVSTSYKQIAMINTHFCLYINDMQKKSP